ncbi:MAG: phage portal protein [Pseudomonadota bacterium]
MNPIDIAVAYFNPQAGLKRRAAREVLARYEAAEPSRMRKFYRERGNQNQIVQKHGRALITQTRHLVRNHDLARGALRTMVNNVVGPQGIGIEPQPRRRDGSIHEEYAALLREAYRDFCLKPEVTHQFTMSRLQRAVGWSWFRDGELFGQMVQGLRADLDHGTRVPFSLEMFECEHVPWDLENESERISQGIERNAWGRPTALHVYRRDPWRTQYMPLGADTRVIPWDRVLHIASLDHLGQMRGVSEFASVITRLEDIKDYEESERVAAKVAAMLTAYVKKGNPDQYEETTSTETRQIDMSAAMIIDDLQVGEEIGMIDSKRPNPNLVTFRHGQLRAFSAGFGTSYSSTSKDYSGTYSAQRQELVEQHVHYAVLTDEFVGLFLLPVWQRFVPLAHLSGVAPMPADLDPGTADDALFVGQAMPWIDPLKEALGWEALVKAGFASEVEVIRKRGGNPHDLLQQIKNWREKCREEGLVFSSNEAALESARAAISGEVSQ